MPAGDLFLPVIADRRRQSQILDHWTTRQVREMFTNIERRSHEAELSALSDVRASSLIQMWREMEAEAYPLGGGSLMTSEEVPGGLDAESEQERRGIGKLVRKMSFRISSWPSSSSEESELQNGSTPAILPTAGSGGKVVRVRGRKEMEGLVMRMKQKRLREIAKLADEQKVSIPFPWEDSGK